MYVLCPGSTEAAGGIGRAMEALLPELSRIRPELDIVYLNTRGDGHILLAPIYFLKALLTLVAAAASGTSTILHVNVSWRGSTLRKYVVVALAAALNLPVILHLHSGGFATFYAALPAPLQRCVRTMFGRADRVIVLGPTWQTFVTDTLGVARERIVIAPNGIRAPRADACWRPGRGGTPHIVFLGRLSAGKGVRELIAALGAPNMRRHSWRATLAGDGDPAPFWQQARELGIAERLHFPGWLDGAACKDLLRSTTVFVLPSHFEGLPMAVVEAVAYGVPVIATGVGALPDFLVDGVSALLIPRRDPARLADAMIRVLDSPNLRERLSVGGRNAFLEYFDIVGIARRVDDVYREVELARSRTATYRVGLSTPCTVPAPADVTDGGRP